MPRPKQITIFWQGPQRRVLIGITHTKNHSPGLDRIEVRALDPKDVPLPIALNGRRTDFISWKELNKAGGAARYVERLVIDGAKSSAWKRHLARLSQPDLFHRADARRTHSNNTPNGTVTSANSERANHPVESRARRRPRRRGCAPR
jgi:hypothetical protein